MHDILLIHYDNTPLLEQFSNNLKFYPSLDELNSSDIDTFMSKQIIPQIQEKSFRIVLIKDTLSENYIDFYGLILAHHIRLSSDVLEEKSLVPIIILSDTTELAINRLTPYGSLLFTNNVFLCQNNIESVDSILAYDLNSLNEEEYGAQFINLIQIAPPQDYLSHHGITNEWAIDQWANMLNVNSDAIRRNREKISSLLYYKYLISKYHLHNKLPLKIKQKKVDGRVLLIDDKWNSGWKDVLHQFVKSYFSDVKFEAFKGIGESNSIEDLKLQVIKNLRSTDSPDVILLDLRLLDREDSVSFNNELGSCFQQINKISGLVILNAIKELNPGIQVIMFTASSDSMILDELRNKGILGYVKKDAPTERYQAPKSSFNKLSKLIELGLSKKYLKKIHHTKEEILRLENINNSEITKNISLVFNILNSNIPQPYLYAMYSIFKCLEIINDKFIRDINRGKDAEWKENNQWIENFNGGFECKIKNILHHKLELDDDRINDEIAKLVYCRNHSIHPGKSASRYKKDFISEPAHHNIEEWFSILKKILVKLDYYELNSVK